MNQLWERIFNADEPPVVIEGDALRNAPEYSLRKYCQAVGLDFQDSQLSWSEGNVRKWPHEEADTVVLLWAGGCMVNMTGTHQAVPVEHFANHLSASGDCSITVERGADDFLDLFMCISRDLI